MIVRRVQYSILTLGAAHSQSQYWTVRMRAAKLIFMTPQNKIFNVWLQKEQANKSSFRSHYLATLSLSQTFHFKTGFSLQMIGFCITLAVWYLILICKLFSKYQGIVTTKTDTGAIVACSCQCKSYSSDVTDNNIFSPSSHDKSSFNSPGVMQL